MTVRIPWIRRGDPIADRPRLTAAVELLPPHVRLLFVLATDRQTLQRRSWQRCPFRCAGEMIGREITTVKQAAEAFDVPASAVRTFIETWDRLPGSDAACTALLREVLAELTEPGGDVAGRGGGEAPAAVRAPELVAV